MTTLSLPPIVAAGAVVDSLGREWDPLEHPRGRDGKFIHTFKRIRAFLDGTGTDPWMTGEVTNINKDGSIRVRITKTTDPSLVDPSSNKPYVGAQVDITPDLVESINEKAVLNLDGTKPTAPTPKANVFGTLGWGGEMVTWKSFRSRFFPDQDQVTLGKVDLDNTINSMINSLKNGESIEQWEADYKEKKGHDYIRDMAKFMIATRLFATSHGVNGDPVADPDKRSNSDFRGALAQLGVDEDIIDDTPDGLSGLDDLAARVRKWKNPQTGLDQAPRTPGAVREIEFGDEEKRVVISGKDYGGSESPVTYSVVDKDGNVDSRKFASLAEAREAALEQTAAPKPPPEPEELEDVSAADLPDEEPTPDDLAELEDDVEEFTDVDTADVRELAQEIHLSDSEYGETYASSINGIAQGVEEGSYSVEEARAELRALAAEIGDEADDTGDTHVEKLAKNLRAAADNLGVSAQAELKPDVDEPEEEDWTPEQIEVLDEYVSASQDINDTLRYETSDDTELVGDLKHITDTLDGVIDSYAFVEDTKVYRGLNAAEDQEGFDSFLASLTPGATIRDRGYMSTTLDPDIAEQFSKNGDNDKPGVFMEIDAPEGAPGFPMNASPFPSGEDEMLLPRNTRLNIEERSVDEDGTVRIRARLLTADEADPDPAGGEIDVPAGVTDDVQNGIDGVQLESEPEITPGDVDDSTEEGPPSGQEEDNEPDQAEPSTEEAGPAADDVDAGPDPSGAPAGPKELTETQHTELHGGPLTASERGALDSYVGVGFMDINNFMRAGYTEADYEDWPSAAQDVKGMKSLMGRSKSKESMVVYRGVSAEDFSDSDWDEFIDSIQVGGIIHDKGFVSTSRDVSVAKQFTSGTGGIVFELDVPAGHPAIDVDILGTVLEGGPEAEIILGDGTKFRIDSLETLDGGWSTIKASVTYEDVPSLDLPGKQPPPVDPWADVDLPEWKDPNAPDADAPTDPVDSLEQVLEADNSQKFEVLDDPGESGDGFFLDATGKPYTNPNGSKMWGKYGASGVMVRHVDDDGIERFLLVQRGNGGYNKGKWQLPGGALESKENDYQGAARELTEELSPPEGYLDKLSPVGEVLFEHPSGWHYNNIAADVDEQFTPVVDGGETSDAQWFTREEIANAITLHPALDDNLDALFKQFTPDQGKATPTAPEAPNAAPATLADFPQPSLTPDESWAVHQVYGYAWGYKLLNPYLHHNKQVWDSNIGGYRDVTPEEDATAKKAIAALDSAFDKAQVLDHPVTVERRSGMELFDEENMVGKDVVNLGYTSTATQLQKHGYGYESKPVLWKITLPEGTKAIQANAFEEEILLNRGAVFHVTEDVTMPNGDRHVSMTYEPSGISTQPQKKRVDVIPEPEPEVLTPEPDAPSDEIVDPGEWDWTIPTSLPNDGQIVPFEEEPELAEWEKELLGYYDDEKELEADGQDIGDSLLPGPESEDWEKMFDDKGAYRWAQDGNKIRVGDKVIGADGLEMTISKFENNNLGVIALDNGGKKRIRSRLKLKLIAPETAPDEPTVTTDPFPAATPDPTPEVAKPEGDMLHGSSWKFPAENFAEELKKFTDAAGDGDTQPGDFFYAGNGYYVTLNKTEQEYSLWVPAKDDEGQSTDDYEYVDGFPASNNYPIHDDLGEQIQEVIATREKSIDDANKVTAQEAKKLDTVNWADPAAVEQLFNDASMVVGTPSWNNDEYVDLGEGYELHYDSVDKVYEIHNSETGEILMPPVGSPNESSNVLADAVGVLISKHKNGYSGVDDTEGITVNANDESEFDTAVADLLERIATEEYSDGDKIVYEGYEVQYDGGGNLKLVYPPTGETLVEVDTGEDFDELMNQLKGTAYQYTYGEPPGTSPDQSLDVPPPNGNMNVFSTWENDPETFAFDFAGFVNDISDGNTGPGDYFDAGDGYNVTYDSISDHWVLWHMAAADTNDQLVAEIPANNDAAETIQNTIKQRETSGDTVVQSEPEQQTLIYSWKDELTAVNDIPKNIPGVIKLFAGQGLTDYQLKQYRNAGYALDDAAGYDVDTPQWNQAVNKAVYNLTEAGPAAQAKLAEVLQWRTNTLNAQHGGVVSGKAPAGDLALPEGFGDIPADAVAVYHYNASTGGALETYAVVHADGQVYYHMKGIAPQPVTATNEVLKNHHLWTPYGGITVSAPSESVDSLATPGPDLSQPHKMDANGNAMFVGDKALWTTKGIEVTITGFENNDIGVIVKSIGPDGKPKKHAINRKKLMLKSSTSHAHSQVPNKQGPPQIVSNSLASKKVDPDPSSPWFGVPQPEKPAPVEVPGLPAGKLIDDDWMEKANENYKKGAKANNPDWTEKELSASYQYAKYYQPAQKGDKSALEQLLNKGYITKEMHEDALAQIYKNNKAHEDALAKNEAAHAKWHDDVKAWRAANGLPTIQLKGMDDGVIKLNNSGAKQWMNANQKPGGLTPQGKLTGPAASAVSSQKGSNISGNLRAGKEKTLDPQWVAANGGFHIIGMDQAMLDSPPLAEDFMVTRTLDMNNFINPATGAPYGHNDPLSNSAGSIQHDWGFAETSIGSYDAGASVGYNPQRKIHMELRLPKGLRGVWTEHPAQPHGYGEERGFILERGIAYYIHSVNWVSNNYGGGYWRVDAEVIPKDVNYDQFGHFINENPFFN